MEYVPLFRPRMLKRVGVAASKMARLAWCFLRLSTQAITPGCNYAGAILTYLFKMLFIRLRKYSCVDCFSFRRCQIMLAFRLSPSAMTGRTIIPGVLWYAPVTSSVCNDTIGNWRSICMMASWLVHVMTIFRFRPREAK